MTDTEVWIVVAMICCSVDKAVVQFINDFKKMTVV